MIAQWSTDSYYKAVISKNNGVDILCDAMDEFPSDSSIQASCCTALEQLASTQQVAIHRAAGIDLIITAMRNHPHSVQVQSAACQALRNMKLSLLQHPAVTSTSATAASDALPTGRFGLAEEPLPLLPHSVEENATTSADVSSIDAATVSKMQRRRSSCCGGTSTPLAAAAAACAYLDDEDDDDDIDDPPARTPNLIQLLVRAKSMYMMTPAGYASAEDLLSVLDVSANTAGGRLASVLYCKNTLKLKRQGSDDATTETTDIDSSFSSRETNEPLWR